jgi:hypothetical protein
MSRDIVGQLLRDPDLFSVHIGHKLQSNPVEMPLTEFLDFVCEYVTEKQKADNRERKSSEMG